MKLRNNNDIFSLCLLVPLLATLTVVSSVNIDEFSCIHTIYILPMYTDLTTYTEFYYLGRYFGECQQKAFQEDMRTKIQVFSLINQETILNCTAGDDCSDQFTDQYFNNTDNFLKQFKLTANETYNFDFLKCQLTGPCLKYSKLIIPTNLRCPQIRSYNALWSLVGDYKSGLNKFLTDNHLNTTIIWTNFNYISPADNARCELNYMLKYFESPLTTVTSGKNGKFLLETAQTDICWSFKEPPVRPTLSTVLKIVVALVCVLILLLMIGIIVLCVLKLRYGYEILQLDFLFRRKPKEGEEVPDTNYYTTEVNGDKWELSMGELDIDHDNVLGSGAFAYVVQGTLLRQRKGTTSRGVNMFNRNLIAVKVLHSTADDVARKNFIREIELMKSFEPHPHMLNLIGCIADPNNPMLVSELCELGDLRQILANHKPHNMSEETHCENPDVVCLRGKDLTSFAWQISDALCYLSSHKFVHRDVAARNVLITRAFTAKLGDFGLCHSLDSHNGLHTTPQGKVPIKWTALEAIQKGVFSEKSDVWSYGVLLFEMYSGASMPYPDIDGEDLEKELLTGVRPDISENTPENIKLLMSSCWVEDPEKRPTFEEIRARLSGLLEVCSQAYGYIQFAQQILPDDEDRSSGSTTDKASSSEEKTDYETGLGKKTDIP